MKTPTRTGMVARMRWIAIACLLVLACLLVALAANAQSQYPPQTPFVSSLGGRSGGGGGGVSPSDACMLVGGSGVPGCGMDAPGMTFPASGGSVSIGGAVFGDGLTYTALLIDGTSDAAIGFEPDNYISFDGTQAEFVETGGLPPAIRMYYTTAEPQIFAVLTTTRVVHFEFDDVDGTEDPIVGRAKVLVQVDNVTVAERNAGAGTSFITCDAEVTRADLPALLSKIRLKNAPILDALPAPPDVKPRV